jgi:hypothetical protein
MTRAALRRRDPVGDRACRNVDRRRQRAVEPAGLAAGRRNGRSRCKAAPVLIDATGSCVHFSHRVVSS